MGPHPAAPGASRKHGGTGGLREPPQPPAPAPALLRPQPAHRGREAKIIAKVHGKGLVQAELRLCQAPSSMPLPRRSERVEKESSPCTPSTLPSLWEYTKRKDPKGGLFGESPPHPGSRCPCGAPGPPQTSPSGGGTASGTGSGSGAGARPAAGL